MPVIANKDNASSVWAIVLTYGGAEAITAACIDSLLAQDHAGLRVLLVDNASFDGSGERLRDRYPQIAYLNTGANLGYAGGNNRGIEHALANGASHVLVLNNDTIVEPLCVSLLVRAASELADVGAVAPKILFFDDPSFIWYAGGDHSVARAVGIHRRERERDTPDDGDVAQVVTFVSGCCLLLPADVLRRVGGFREEFFMYCEDVELSLRLRHSGLRLYYQPAARVLHRDPLDGNGVTPFQILHRDRNRRRIVKQHYTLPQRIRFAFWFYPSRVGRVAQYAWRREWDRARAVVSAMTSDI